MLSFNVSLLQTPETNVNNSFVVCSSSPVLLYSGGMPRASYGDRHCLTVQQDKTHVTLDFTSRVIDFFTVHNIEQEKGKKLMQFLIGNDLYCLFSCLLQSLMIRLHWWCYWKRSSLWSTSRALGGPLCPLPILRLFTPQPLPAPSTSPVSLPNSGRDLWMLARPNKATSKHIGWEAHIDCCTRMLLSKEVHRCDNDSSIKVLIFLIFAHTLSVMSKICLSFHMNHFTNMQSITFVF